MFDTPVGKYVAVVTHNSTTDTTCPFPGCVKVVCPDLLGMAPLPRAGMTFEESIGYMFESDWVRPVAAHPADVYIPAVGETVYVECLGGRGVSSLVWCGVAQGVDYETTFVPDLAKQKKRAGTNPQFAEKTDRIIGTRNGSYVKIEDKENGKLRVEVYGKEPNFPDRLGTTLLVDPTPGAESLEIVVRVADDSKKARLTIKPEVIQLVDNSGNTVSFGSAGITITDKNGMEVSLAAAGITLKSGDAAAWLPNIIPNCIFSGAPHGGTGAGVVKLKGA